jgi:twinkle protein
MTSQVISRTPCPKCRDAGNDTQGNNLINYDDGHSYCYACNYLIKGDGESMPLDSATIRTDQPTITLQGIAGPIKDRRISEEIVRKFGVTLEKGDNGEYSRHNYPYFTSDVRLVGAKVRTVSNKQFHVNGTLDGTGLFGQHLWREGGRYVTVTEGEADALAVAEMFDGKWPVVSIKRGSASALKDIKENLEWLETFENVIICFDMDDAGKKAADAVLPLFSHNKVRVVTLPYKDAGEMLKHGKVKEFTSAWWDAKPYRPVDVVSFSDDKCWEAFVKRGTEEIIPLPEAYGSLNAMMNGGIAAGEVTVIGALTSVGKTTMVFNLLYDMVLQSGKKIGAVFLESDLGETVEKIVSLHSGENISLVDPNSRDNSLYREYYDDFGSHDNVHILEHLGMSDVDDLFAKMRWMAKGIDCDVLVVDPLHAAVKSDENGTIDAFMDRCLKLAKETGVSVVIISHMRKPQVKDPHDVNEYDMKGSGSINQIAFNTILLSRDKMSEDDYTRNSTLVQLVKCRRTGRTGRAGWLFYETETGRMVQGQAPEIQAVENEEF